MSKSWLLKKLLERKKKKTPALDRILFGILAVGSAMLMAFFAYLIWFTLTNRSVTYFLPAEKTVAYFELEDMTLPPKLSQNTVFDMIGITAILKTTFGLDIISLQENLTHGRVGLALLKDESDGNKLLLFFRIRNKDKAIEYFKSLGLQNEGLTKTGEKKEIIYSYPQSHTFVFSFIGPYMFIAENADSLKLIQSVYSTAESSLNEDEDYQKSLANLPKQVWGRGYLNIQALDLGAGKPISQLIDPLKYILNHFAITIRKQQNGFHFNTLLSINPEMLATDKGYTDSSLFAYGLADFLGSKNLAAYIGGENLSDEWESTLQTISELNPAYGIILEGIVRAQVTKIFGDDVDLRDDIYPLFDGEYALALESLETASSDEEDPGDTESESARSHLGVKLILKHSDVNFAKTKLEKMMKGFRLLAAQFAPKLKIVPLPDGTESKELVADQTRLKEISETYNDYEIECLDVTDSSYGFCYTVTDKLIVMSNDPDSIKETIDLSTSPKFVLSQSQPFRQALSNLSAISDEITYVQIDNADKLLAPTKAGSVTKKLAESFEALTWIKHYFDDGVSTEGYLLLK